MNTKERNKVLKAGVWYTISNFIAKGLAFLTMPIFTRLMTSNDIGMYSNIISWFNVLAIITTFELFSSVSIARFDHKDNLDEYISSSLILGTIITLLFYIVVIIFNDFFTDLFGMDFISMNIVFIYLLVYPSTQMLLIKNQINYNYRSTIIISLLNAFLSTIVSIIMVVLLKNKLFGRTIGYFIPLIFTSFIIYIHLIKKGAKVSSKYWKYALFISFPLIWHLLAGYILSSSDKIMITKIVGADENALYSVAYTISMVVSILWNSMNNAWAPWAYKQMDEKKYCNLEKYSKPYTIFFLFIVSIFMLIGPELLLVMGGRHYYIAKYVIPPVMVGYIFQFVYSLYVNIEFYHKKQCLIAIGTIIAAIINIILNLIFIPKYGYYAAAYTTLISYIFLLIIHYVFVVKMKCSNWYDTNFFARVSIIALIIMTVCLLSYSTLIIRYLLIVTLIVYLVLKIRKRINMIPKNERSKSIIVTISKIF